MRTSAHCATAREAHLIINADDLGISRGVTDAILIAHRYGVLTSASLMANMPAASYAIERLKTAPALCAGIHLNICEGAPLLPPQEVPTLVGPDGCFHPPAEMIRRLWCFQVAPSEIESEFRAQIRWLKGRGIDPTHADSHHHMHIYPAAARPFARALKAEGIRRARTARFLRSPCAHTIGGPHDGTLLRRILVQTYRAALQSIAFRKIAVPDARIAFSFGAADRLIAQWVRILDALPPGTFELACHPGFSETGFSETDAIALQREHELRVLMNANLRAAIVRNHIRLITYRDLPIAATRRSRAVVPTRASVPRPPA